MVTMTTAPVTCQMIRPCHPLGRSPRYAFTQHSIAVVGIIRIGVRTYKYSICSQQTLLHYNNVDPLKLRKLHIILDCANRCDSDPVRLGLGRQQCGTCNYLRGKEITY